MQPPSAAYAAALPRALASATLALLLVACTGVTSCTGATCDGSSRPPSGGPDDAPSGTVRLYTSVTQDTVDAVLAAYAGAFPHVTVEVFRAPTGELDARIATEKRTGRIAGDVLWGTDPLSVQAYAQQGLFRAWTPPEADAVPPAYRSSTFWGTRILNMVIVHRTDADPAPADWRDLADPAYAGKVGLPDPGFAGSAFGMLGYFATTDGYGMDFYRALHDNGAVQVQAIAEVLTDVAEGRFTAGITLDKTARDAIAQGSPVEIAWPSSGAIAIYSPVAVFADTTNPAAAESFANFLLTREGQAAIAGTGWQPVRDDVAGGPPIDGTQVAPSWDGLFSRQEELLGEYRAIFGG
ncbi:MAG TPA: extracellular solute-binding protein [Candidatus Limnocylindria bacterium]